MGRIPNLTAIKVVSWDVDGTLYPIASMKARLATAFLRRSVRGGALTAYRELRVLQDHRTALDARRGNGRVGENCDWEEPDVAAHWYRSAIERAGTRAGVEDLLAFFDRSGHTQVVLSDLRAQYKLHALGIRDRFHAVYEGSVLGFLKPSPDGFRRIVDDYGIEPHELLHVGDRVETDGAGARAAGCHSLILGRDFRGFPQLLVQLQIKGRRR